MDKSWINESRVSSEYEVGVKQFLDFAFDHVALSGMIPCPCKNCNNVWNHPREVVLEHLICYGFDQGYARITWGLHGETTPPSSPNELLDEDEHCGADYMHGMLNGAFGIFNADGVPLEEPNAEAARFYKLMEDAEQELYPGCKKFSKLSFIVRLFHIKCLNGWSDKSFTMLLELLKEALPVGETLPKSFYESKKIVNNLGLEYNKIDACPNDCILYWKQYANDVECKICGSSRWKASDEGVVLSSTSDKKVPAKVLRHFPLKPRLQRLYMSTKTSDLMSWHVDGRTKDGVLRHPGDSKAWETLDNKYPDFAAEPRNVRLGLASDGFNPFGSMSITHSTWPVVLMPYNLPPWLCMKQSYFMIALLIGGVPLLRQRVQEIKQIGKKVKMPHTMGTKTYARMREDERDKLGHEPDKMHMFKVGHIRKKWGGTLDAPVQTALTAMERHLTQMPEETDSITAKDIAFTKVMGEDSHGRAQTYGMGVAPPSRRNDLSAEALADAERRVEEERARRLLADETLTTLQEELKVVKQEQEQMKKEREEDRIAREEQRIQLLRFTKLMQSFENHIGSSLSFDSESTTC